MTVKFLVLSCHYNNEIGPAFVCSVVVTTMIIHAYPVIARCHHRMFVILKLKTRQEGAALGILS